MMVPRLFSIIDVDILGWILVIGGITQMGRAMYLSKMPGFGAWLSMSILQILAGYVLILKPDVGVITITSLIALFFAYEGSIKIYLAVTEKELPNNKMMLFSGLTSLVFALVMVSFWPEIEHWILGLLLGINMLILGATLVKYGFFLRRNRI